MLGVGDWHFRLRDLDDFFVLNMWRLTGVLRNCSLVFLYNEQCNIRVLTGIAEFVTRLLNKVLQTVLGSSG